MLSYTCLLLCVTAKVARSCRRTVLRSKPSKCVASSGDPQSSGYGSFGVGIRGAAGAAVVIY